MKIRILIVDDCPDFLESLVRLLTSIGRYEVTTAENGREGLDRLRENHFEVVITDNQMPEMDGPAFVKEGKKLFPDLPFILMSSGTISGGLAIIARECGANGSYEKLDGFRKLEATIQTLVGH
ncbi:MAG: response regulator [Patescibacteria group bacterium]